MVVSGYRLDPEERLQRIAAQDRRAAMRKDRRAIPKTGRRNGLTIITRSDMLARAEALTLGRRRFLASRYAIESMKQEQRQLSMSRRPGSVTAIADRPMDSEAENPYNSSAGAVATLAVDSHAVPDRTRNYAD